MKRSLLDVLTEAGTRSSFALQIERVQRALGEDGEPVARMAVALYDAMRLRGPGMIHGQLFHLGELYRFGWPDDDAAAAAIDRGAFYWVSFLLQLMDHTLERLMVFGQVDGVFGSFAVEVRGSYLGNGPTATSGSGAR